MLHSPAELALSYARANIPCFPCRHAEEIDDITGEIYSPKTPLTPNGLKGATTNERIVREWWKRNPDAMVGLPTGSRAGFFALDIDNKPGGANGFDWLDEMQSEYGPLPATKTSKTPNGGLHILFNYVAGTRNRGALGAGVDIRSEGGYIIGAGSVMGDGRHYEWVDPDAPIADAPPWLLELVLPRPVATTTYRPAYSVENTAYVSAAVDAEVSNLAHCGIGNRNNQLNDAAFSLGTLVGASALLRSEAEDALMSIAAQWPNLPKSRGTIKRGIDAGIQHPRQVPERGGDDTPVMGLGKMVKSSTPPKSRIEESAPQAESEKHMQFSDSLSRDVEPPPAFIITPYQWKNPRKLARREFAFGTHYIRKYVSVTVSPGGIGKTSNSIVEALSMVSGRDLTGVKPPSRLKVFLFNAEDPRDEMERRIQAACLHYRLSANDINGHLFLDTGREQDLVVAIDDKKTGTRIQVPVVEAVINQITKHQIDVMIVDPFVSTHAVNENDNGAIDKVAKLWAQIADDTNCAIDIVHHLRKVADREATVEDARGAVSLIGAARSVRVLNRMSEDQADAAGVQPSDRVSYFNIHQGKANLTKLSSNHDWRRLESVPLGNGTTFVPQDFAGVVTEWKWPSKEEVAEAIPDDKLELIRVRLGNQDYKTSDQSEDWAGYAIAEIMGDDLPISKAMTSQKRKYKRIIEAWIDAGILVNEKVPNPRKIGLSMQVLRPVRGD